MNRKWSRCPFWVFDFCVFTQPGSKAAFSVRLLNVCFHQQRTLADAQLIPVEVRRHVGAAVPGLVILLIPRKRLGPLKGCLAVNRIRI